MEEASIERAIERDVVILNGLVEHAPREIEKDFPGANTCILATRVGMAVLKRLGVRCRAVPVTLTVFNEEFIARFNQEGRLPHSKEEAKQWMRECGAYAVGAGTSDDPDYVRGDVDYGANRFHGHLVILADHTSDEDYDGVLVDLSLQQNSSPNFGLVLEPLTATAPTGFMADDDPVVARVGGCVVRYQRMDTVAWTRTPDWQDEGRRHFIVERTIKKIELKLAARGLA